MDYCLTICYLVNYCFLAYLVYLLLAPAPLCPPALYDFLISASGSDWLYNYFSKVKQLITNFYERITYNYPTKESGLNNLDLLWRSPKYKKALEDYNNIQKPEVLPETESLRETYVTKAVAPTSDNLSSGMAPQPLLLKQIILIL